MTTIASPRQSMTIRQNQLPYSFEIANRLSQISQTGTGTVLFSYDNADRQTLMTLLDAGT